jgi:uncharacterized lipoprotein YehR (DUF1307 family)
MKCNLPHLVSVLLAVVLSFALTGCGESKQREAIARAATYEAGADKDSLIAARAEYEKAAKLAPSTDDGKMAAKKVELLDARIKQLALEDLAARARASRR